MMDRKNTVRNTLLYHEFPKKHIVGASRLAVHTPTIWKAKQTIQVTPHVMWMLRDIIFTVGSKAIMLITAIMQMKTKSVTMKATIDAVKYKHMMEEVSPPSGHCMYMYDGRSGKEEVC